MNLRITFIFSVFLLISCTQFTSVDEKGRVVVHHFGYVRIIKPPIVPSNKPINVTGVKILGFSVQNGFTIGYKEKIFMQIPMDCRVMIVVESEAQLRHLIEHMPLLEGGNICAAVSPE